MTYTHARTLTRTMIHTMTNTITSTSKHAQTQEKGGGTRQRRRKTEEDKGEEEVCPRPPIDLNANPEPATVSHKGIRACGGTHEPLNMKSDKEFARLLKSGGVVKAFQAIEGRRANINRQRLKRPAPPILVEDSQDAASSSSGAAHVLRSTSGLYSQNQTAGREASSVPAGSRRHLLQRSHCAAAWPRRAVA